MRILRSNLESALKIAIEAQAVRDQAAGIQESCFVAGLREVLWASQRGEVIETDDNYLPVTHPGYATRHGNY